MSMHKIKLTELERSGLEAHHLQIESPSQLSDCFRLGVAWALGDNSCLGSADDRLKTERAINLLEKCRGNLPMTSDYQCDLARDVEDFLTECK